MSEQQCELVDYMNSITTNKSDGAQWWNESAFHLLIRMTLIRDRIQELMGQNLQLMKFQAVFLALDVLTIQGHITCFYELLSHHLRVGSG